MLATSGRLGSSATTQGIRVEVTPSYMADQSRPDDHDFNFSYRVRLINVGDAPAQLISRHWIIVDGKGERHDVEGLGVVGKQPRLEPGDVFEYSSYCPLKTPWGTMEGTFLMRRDDATEFEAVVARFYLAAPQNTPRPTR